MYNNMKAIRRILIILLVILISISIVSQMTIAHGVQGIYVSHHNTVRWNLIDTSVVKFAYIKISEGATFVDWEGKNNILRAEDAGGRYDTTPFLLARIKDITGGDSLDSNIQLVLNNARLAARTAALSLDMYASAGVGVAALLIRPAV